MEMISKNVFLLMAAVRNVYRTRKKSLNNYLIYSSCNVISGYNLQKKIWTSPGLPLGETLKWHCVGLLKVASQETR